MKREGGEKRSLLSIASQLSQVSPVLCDPAGQRESEHVCQTVFMLQKQEIGFHPRGPCLRFTGMWNCVWLKQANHQLRCWWLFWPRATRVYQRRDISDLVGDRWGVKNWIFHFKDWLVLAHLNPAFDSVNIALTYTCLHYLFSYLVLMHAFNSHILKQKDKKNGGDTAWVCPKSPKSMLQPQIFTFLYKRSEFSVLYFGYLSGFFLKVILKKLCL